MDIKDRNNPFYVLLYFLESLNSSLEKAEPVSHNAYKNYILSHFTINNIFAKTDLFKYIKKDMKPPFKRSSMNFLRKQNDLFKQKDIIKFIYDFDLLQMSKMIDSIFVRLIRFLVERRGTINLLDVGTGSTCGLYNESFKFLFNDGKVDTRGINFYGVDDSCEPHGSFFESSIYKKCNILFFNEVVKFDLITGHHVLEHCYNWDDVIKHVCYLLKDEGYLYLSFPKFGGFYDSAYRLMAPSDHCSFFDLENLIRLSDDIGLQHCLTDIYVDPRNRFSWISKLYPELINEETADYFYELCVKIDSKLLLGFHEYGHYVVFQKISK